MKKKNWLIVALCIAIAGMGIGFAALAQNLQINATANITGEWDVRIVNFEPLGASSPRQTWGTRSFDATGLILDIDLPYPGSWVEYTINVKNEGNINAILNSITGLTQTNNTNPSEIQLIVRNIWSESGDDASVIDTDKSSVGTILNVGAQNIIVIRVEWIVKDNIESAIPDAKSKTFTINLNYVQAT